MGIEPGEYKRIMGETVMTAMDNIDEELIAGIEHFSQCAFAFAQLLLRKGTDADDTIGNVAAIAAGSAFHALKD